MTRLSDQECRTLLAPAPPLSSVWRHYKGGLVTVIAVSLFDSDRGQHGAILVTYRHNDSGLTWTRTLQNFFARVTFRNKDNLEEVVSRFTPAIYTPPITTLSPPSPCKSYEEARARGRAGYYESKGNGA